MPADSPPAETAAHGLDEGVALALRADDSGDWKAVADWLARNPDHAGGLADFLAAQRGLRSAARPVVPTPDHTGAVIDGFELREEIDRGAMGIVYRAHDPVLKRDVAMKLIRTGGLPSAIDLALFRHEALTAANLDHPHVVRVFAFGEADGVPYIVMPLMEGGSLAKRLKDLGPDRCLAPKVAADLVRDIALGVHHAHQRGLIHRDLKPGNILLDANGRPHVADFGLARSLDVTASVSGGIAGTPAYMAPEQARGEKCPTFAVDVWGLGAILFELLTGRPPFGTGELPVILKRVQEEPAPSVRELRADVPVDLATICRKCLAKEPADRHSSALVLADNLSRFLNGEPLNGESRGWVWESVSRALGWQREVLSMNSWRVAFWGGASTGFAMAVMQAAILLDAPLWVSQAAIAYYLLGWLSLMWWYLVARRDSLNPVERASTAIHFGAKFACLAILPVPMWLHDGNPVYALPSFLVLVGLAVFIHGVTYWGRLYLSGLAFFAVAAAMPLVPVTYWPTIYGVLLVALQVQMGFHLRRVHKHAEAVRSRAAPLG